MSQKVVCLMPTLGRFRIAERSISFFLAQTYENKELVVYNQSPVPMIADFPQVKVVNVHREFSGLSEVYTEALKFCDGDLINMWDDDNGAFPWLLEDTIRHKTRKGAKSEKSWVWSQEKLTTGQNLLEPSIVFDIDVIREIGFTPGKSFVHTKWFYHLYHGGELQHIPEDVMMPGLVYCWGEAGSGCWHISCTSNESQGFEGFKNHSKDFGTDGVVHRVNVMEWYDKVTKCHPAIRTRLGLS